MLDNTEGMYSDQYQNLPAKGMRVEGAGPEGLPGVPTPEPTGQPYDTSRFSPETAGEGPQELPPSTEAQQTVGAAQRLLRPGALSPTEAQETATAAKALCPESGGSGRYSTGALTP